MKALFMAKKTIIARFKYKLGLLITGKGLTTITYEGLVGIDTWKINKIVENVLQNIVHEERNTNGLQSDALCHSWEENSEKSYIETQHF